MSARLIEFCQSISQETPRFIQSRPSRDAVFGHCFDNVARKVERAGGEIAYGWAIWNMHGLYFEAEHHGVWRKRQGALVDVTPQANNYSKILFLPDPNAAYDPSNFRDNLFAPDSDAPIAIEFVELARRRTAIFNSYRAGGMKVAFFSTVDQSELDALAARMQIIISRHSS
jgi:hypothetical protein